MLRFFGAVDSLAHRHRTWGARIGLDQYIEHAVVLEHRMAIAPMRPSWSELGMEGACRTRWL